jgi:hypothetical protein
MAAGKSLYLPGNPGKDYYQLARKIFNESAWTGSANETLLASQYDFLKLINEHLQYKPTVQITASPYVSTQIARVEDKIHIFIANFKGLKGEENPVQLPEQNVQVVFPGTPQSKVFQLDYLGTTQLVTVQYQDGKVSCTLPEIRKGAIVWME